MKRAGLALMFCLLASAAPAQTRTSFPAPAEARTTLQVHGATDLSAIRPLILDFQQQYPDIAVEYVEYNTIQIFKEASDACGKQHTFHVVISSAVDHLVKMANDGCAVRHTSPDAQSRPDWSRWRNEVFGFTFEPAAIVYNKQLVPPEDVPKTRADLIELLRRVPERYRGKVGTYDVRQSGVGYLFAQMDEQEGASYGRLLETLGRADMVGLCCTTDLLDAIVRGDIHIGYNLLASYAVGRMLDGAPIGIVLPYDYTVVLSRAAIILKGGNNYAAAKRFLDYILSSRGQTIVEQKSFFFHASGGVPKGVDARDFEGTTGIIRQIRIGAPLLAVQDQARRSQFLGLWDLSLGQPQKEKQ